MGEVDSRLSVLRSGLEVRKWRLCYKLGRKVYCRLHSESEREGIDWENFFFSKDKHELVYRRKNKEFIG